MQFSKVLTTLVATMLGPLASAAPATDPNTGLDSPLYDNTSSITGNMTANASTITTSLAGYPDAYCVFTPWPLVTQWEVSYPNDEAYNENRCARGLLDNVRHYKMCSPTMWKCKKVGDNGQVVATFNTFNICFGKWVSKAIAKSTYGHVKIPCHIG